MLAENRARLARTVGMGRTVVAAPLTPGPAPVAVGAVGFSLVLLFVTFLKIGATLYGSGYVLLAFLRDDFVHRLGWLTDHQLLDAIAVGQFTPAPVFTTATFIRYLTVRWLGGILATVGIFLPAFIFAAAGYPAGPRPPVSPS